jgi:site-specific DNA-methyltransferase (adenine-specific)
MSAGITELVQLHEGSSASMFQVPDGAADLVLTSPPYFSEETEARLRQPLADQTDKDQRWKELTAFAAGLRANFDEIARVLRPGGVLVLQTKDIRYGEFLLPLASLHLDMVRACGLELRTRVDWLVCGANPARRPAYASKPMVGNFRALDTEQFLVFSKGPLGLAAPSTAEGGGLDPDWTAPLWRTGAAAGKRHRHGSPPEVVRRFLKLYTRPGDLVIEPFCGFGTTLVEAARLGRRCVGYEIDRECAAITREKLQ